MLILADAAPQAPTWATFLQTLLTILATSLLAYIFGRKQSTRQSRIERLKEERLAAHGLVDTFEGLFHQWYNEWDDVLTAFKLQEIVGTSEVTQTNIVNRLNVQSEQKMGHQMSRLNRRLIATGFPELFEIQEQISLWQVTTHRQLNYNGPAPSLETLEQLQHGLNQQRFSGEKVLLEITQRIEERYPV